MQGTGSRALPPAFCSSGSCGSWAPEHWLGSCGAQAQLLCDMWDLPRPGTKPVSPGLAGGFFTTEPPGSF